jgi:hypothetical protein
LLAATLYQENPDRNHKLWNIVSTERYIHFILHAGAAGMMKKMKEKHLFLFDCSMNGRVVSMATIEW